MRSFQEDNEKDHNTDEEMQIYIFYLKTYLLISEEDDKHILKICKYNVLSSTLTCNYTCIKLKTANTTMPPKVTTI